MVHVASQVRHRQLVAGVMTVANVSMTVELQDGQATGRSSLPTSPDPHGRSASLTQSGGGWPKRSRNFIGARPRCVAVQLDLASSLCRSRSMMTEFRPPCCALGAGTPVEPGGRATVRTNLPILCAARRPGQ
jgi:hypothetical protein